MATILSIKRVCEKKIFGLKSSDIHNWTAYFEDHYKCIPGLGAGGGGGGGGWLWLAGACAKNHLPVLQLKKIHNQKPL